MEPDVGTRWTYSRGARPCQRRSRFAGAALRAIIDAHLRALIEAERARRWAEFTEFADRFLGGELVGIGEPVRRAEEVIAEADEQERRARVVAEEWRRDLRVSHLVAWDPARFVTVVDV